MNYIHTDKNLFIQLKFHFINISVLNELIYEKRIFLIKCNTPTKYSFLFKNKKHCHKYRLNIYH